MMRLAEQLKRAVERGENHPDVSLAPKSGPPMSIIVEPLMRGQSERLNGITKDIISGIFSRRMPSERFNVLAANPTIASGDVVCTNLFYLVPFSGVGPTYIEISPARLEVSFCRANRDLTDSVRDRYLDFLLDLLGIGTEKE